MKANELQFEALFQKTRGLAKRLQDLSYQISRLERKADETPDGDNKKEVLLTFYLAMALDIEGILKELKEAKKEYGNIK